MSQTPAECSTGPAIVICENSRKLAAGLSYGMRLGDANSPYQEAWLFVAAPERLHLTHEVPHRVANLIQPHLRVNRADWLTIPVHFRRRTSLHFMPSGLLVEILCYFVDVAGFDLESSRCGMTSEPDQSV